MKITLLLACFLVFTLAVEARTSPRIDHIRLKRLGSTSDQFRLPLTEGVFEELKKLLDYLAKAALDAVHKFKTTLDKHLSEATQKLEELLQLANGSINDYLEEAKQNLTSIGSQVSECVVPATAELEKVAAHSYENTKKCYDDVVVRFKILTDNVEEHIAFGLGKVEEIEHIAEECVKENPKLLDQVNCVLDHMNESIAIVEEIVGDVGKLTAETSRELISLSNDTRGCLLDMVRMSRNEVDKVISEVLECMKEHNLNPAE